MRKKKFKNKQILIMYNMENNIDLKINISETPERWVILEIKYNDEIFYKVFATWAGGYLGSDSYRVNSGIAKIEQDDDYYYFIGFSDSCYKCRKKAYGVITLYGKGVLAEILEKGAGKIIVLEDREDWTKLILK